MEEQQQLDAQFVRDLDLSDQAEQRIAKLRRLQAAGSDPYPACAERSHSSEAARNLWAEISTAGLDEHGEPRSPGVTVEREDHAQGEMTTFAGDASERNPTISLSGRIVLVRIMGKASFVTIEDISGRLQLYFKKEVMGEAAYQSFKDDLDLGDFISVSGTLFETRTHELSLKVLGCTLISKSLRPLPDKWHGVTDVETRYRQRYVDLLANPETREVFRTRVRLVAFVRRFLDERDYYEAETPILQPVYGGGAAVPFTTEYKALDQTFYLRIADELYLKRLIVGGFERVYEIGHDFRNEGTDATHSPEFTMIELYQAYANYETMMELFEAMCVGLAQQIKGSLQFDYQGMQLDFTPPWPRVDMRQALIEQAGFDFLDYPDDEVGRRRLCEHLRGRGLRVEPTMRWAKLVDEALGEYVEPGFTSPTFLLGHPVALSPLAKRKSDNPLLTERFEAYMGGFEIANAFSELNDPIDQYARFLAAGRDAAAGDEEAHRMDVDFLTALSYGMPPTGGMGIGIDRLAMIFTNQAAIRDVILFPALRSKE